MKELKHAKEHFDEGQQPLQRCKIMTLDEAARILRQMYDHAPYGEKVAHIHLFGIKYADQLQNLTDTEIVREAGLKDSYPTEVAKGRRLSKYVVVKADQR